MLCPRSHADPASPRILKQVDANAAAVNANTIAIASNAAASHNNTNEIASNADMTTAAMNAANANAADIGTNAADIGTNAASASPPGHAFSHSDNISQTLTRVTTFHIFPLNISQKM